MLAFIIMLYAIIVTTLKYIEVNSQYNSPFYTLQLLSSVYIVALNKLRPHIGNQLTYVLVGYINIYILHKYSQKLALNIAPPK